MWGWHVRGTVVIAAIVFALGVAGVAQRGAALPRFDVVSIRPAPRPRIRHPYAAARAVLPGGRYSNRYALLYDLLAFAYPEYTADQTLTGLPAWVSSHAHGAYYDVEAEAAPNTSPSLAQMRLMMQSLLALRFGLEYHIEHRVMAVFFLEVAKSGTRGITPSVPGERYEFPVTLLSMASNGVTAHAVTMDDVASRLAAASAVFDRPVLDRTGMTGRYDIEVPPPLGQPLLGAAQESYSTVLQDKLGLRLIAGTAAVPVMVIDRVQHATPN